MATMPHCDSAVLHAPGECEYCDAYPSWQEARQAWGIAFTGHPPTDEQPLPCPSETHRDLDTINRWPGNRPSPRPSTSTSTSATGTATTVFIDTAIASDRLKEIVRQVVQDMLREERNTA